MKYIGQNSCVSIFWRLLIGNWSWCCQKSGNYTENLLIIKDDCTQNAKHKGLYVDSLKGIDQTSLLTEQDFKNKM